MILRNVHIIGQQGLQHIYIGNGKIIAILQEEMKISGNETVIEYEGALAFPGFINSHDHLDFNLFTQTGNRIYNNYTEWGKDIHQQNKKEIDEVLKVPQEVRIKWGLYKNLLNGVTTVISHGKKLKIKDDLITVLQPYSLHSPQFEKGWKRKFNNPFIKGPVVMHIGEGTDKKAEDEINEVIRWNIFKRKIVAIHGVAMNEKQVKHFDALVWCPASNYFMLNQTAPVNKLKKKTPVLFGTDSALTSSWNLWEHLRKAKKSNMVSSEELLQMLTTSPAKLWDLNNCGQISAGKDADIIIAKNVNDFFSLNPEDLLMTIHKGRIKLFNEIFAKQIEGFTTNDFSKIMINNTSMFVQGDLRGLAQEIRKYYPVVQFPFIY